jgi:CBS domain-containing protein
MTRDVVVVGPDTSVKDAAELMATRGFAALPVVDDHERMVGIVAEVDVLRDRLPADPRLHVRRDEEARRADPPVLVRGVMTQSVRTVDAGADVADVARLFVDERMRSVPVVDHDRLAGIVSRRDLLRGIWRPDEEVRSDLVELVEDYTGDVDAWDVTVAEGVATIRRVRGRPQISAAVENRALRTLAATVGGIIAVRVSSDSVDHAPHGSRR